MSLPEEPIGVEEGNISHVIVASSVAAWWNGSSGWMRSHSSLPPWTSQHFTNFHPKQSRCSRSTQAFPLTDYPSRPEAQLLPEYKQSCSPPAAAAHHHQQQRSAGHMTAQSGLASRRVLLCVYWHGDSGLCLFPIRRQSGLSPAAHSHQDGSVHAVTSDCSFLFRPASARRFSGLIVFCRRSGESLTFVSRIFKRLQSSFCRNPSVKFTLMLGTEPGRDCSVCM